MGDLKHTPRTGSLEVYEMAFRAALSCPCRTASAENLASFEKVWSTVRDRYWDVKKLENLGGGRSWQTVHDEFALRLQKTESDREARAVMTEMMGLLGQSHFAILAEISTTT
jgi:hypothetical protein